MGIATAGVNVHVVYAERPSAWWDVTQTPCTPAASSFTERGSTETPLTTPCSTHSKAVLTRWVVIATLLRVLS